MAYSQHQSTCQWCGSDYCCNCTNADKWENFCSQVCEDEYHEDEVEEQAKVKQELPILYQDAIVAAVRSTLCAKTLTTATRDRIIELVKSVCPSRE